MEHHILHSFAKTTTIIVTFDLWMSCGRFNTWRYYTNKKWRPCPTIKGIFEIHETIGVTMALQLKDLLIQYDLLDKGISYVKDGCANLNTPIMILIRIVPCAPFMLPQLYVVCYDHAMFKCCLYATNDLKMSNEMKKVSIEKIQSSF
jgi:hypothetical protein